MPRLSHWLSRRQPGRQRLPLRRALLVLEQLEDRVVPTLLGQQLFPSDYPWNQNIANAPVASNSATVISHIGSSIKIHPDWGEDSTANGSSPLYGIPFNVVHGNTTAKVNVIIDNYPGESDIVPVPIPANAVIEGDYQNGPNPNGGGYNTGQRGDSHLLVWDEDNNVAYELYGVTRPSDPTLFPNTSGVELAHTDGQWHAAQESVWNMNADSFRSLGYTSADAAGLSIQAGLARPDEGLPTTAGGQGAINHALRFTLPSGDVNPQYIYPASHVVNTSSGSSNLPFGARLRLMNNSSVNSLISSMGPQAQVIAHAMQQYGLVLADIGSAMYVTGTSASEDANNKINYTWNMSDVLGLSALTASDFQVVNLAPVVTGLSASSGTAGSTVTITGQNFSGSAGHLSVLFGGVAASSVTYVDDSHITAVVPNGSGTVHVQVQSGVNETDPNNPADNVNNPIFGYGISATSSADQFTYGSTQTISGTNSTASFATLSVASGNTDALTIVVKDTSGNAVTGLASSAFTFSLSGGTSAGTFGPVSATATPGTYTTAFTGTTAGTASTLTITVNGVTLSTKPSVSVTPGAVNAANSTASVASANVASGNTDTLTIVVKDGSGNAVSGLSSSAFAFRLSGGTSAGTFGSVTASATPGTYTATFTATTAGTASTLTTTVNGVSLNSRPTITVTPGGVSAANSTASFATSSVVSGHTDTLTIVVKDAAGNAVTGLSSSAFGFSLSGGTSSGTFAAVTATSTPGTYTTTFTATAAGTVSTLTTTVSGVILNSKPTITVNAVSISGANSTASFNTAAVAAGESDALTIVVKDTSGNAVTGLASSAFTFSLSGGTSAGTFGPVSATATPGTYTATFTGTTIGSTSTLTTTVNGVTLTSKPNATVRVNDGAVVAILGSGGVSRWTPAGGWVQIDSFTPQSIVVDGNSNVVAIFANNGIWRWVAVTNTWTQIDPNTPQSVAADAVGNVAGLFANNGVWRWVATTNTWSQIDPNTPQSIAVDGAGNVVGIFARNGVWRWAVATNTWTQIDTHTPQSLAVGANGDVVVIDSSSGVRRWTPASGTWTKIDSFTPQAVAVDAAGDVIGNFGGSSLWRWVPATNTWTQIDTMVAQSIAVDGGGNVTEGLGAAGLRRWTLAGGWKWLTQVSIVAVAMDGN